MSTSQASLLSGLLGGSAAKTPDHADILFVQETIAHRMELERSESSAPATRSRDDEVVGLRFVTSMMKATLFTDYFCYHADIRFMHPTRQERVDAHVIAHPNFYKWCRNLDFGARFGLLVIVSGVALYAAIGSIFRLFFA